MTTKEKIAVMQAYIDGKTIEYRDKKEDDVWCVTHEPLWDWDTNYYRVKPDYELRPYKDAEEFLQAQGEHGLYIEIETDMYIMPMSIRECSFLCAYGKSPITFAELVDKKWQDGTPCGIKEE